MNTKVIGISIAAFIGIVVLASVLMPVLDDATTVNETFSNKEQSIAYFDKVDLSGDNEVTVFWDHTKPTKLTVDGNEFDLPDVSSYPNGISLVVSGELAIRYYKQSSGTYFVQSIGEGNAGLYGYASSAGNTDVSITLNSSGWTYNTSTIQLDGDVYVISDAGDYVMKTPAADAYMLEDSSSAALGITVIGGEWVIMGWNSDSGVDIQPAEYYPPNGYTITNTAIDSTEQSNYKGLSTLNKVTFTATKVSDSSVSANVTYSYFIVPAEVTAERSVHLTDNQNALFAVIPMLVIVAILIGVVALVIRSRLD